MVSKTAGSTSIQDEETGDKANVSISGDGVTKSLNVLAETKPDATGLSTSPYLIGYHAENSKTDIDIDSTSTPSEVYSYTGAGKFISFWAEMENEKSCYEVYVDGVLVVTMDLDVYKDAKIGEYYPFRMEIYYEENQKTMGHNPKYPIRFSTSLEIKFRKINGSNKVKGWHIALTKDLP
jgi:hypothetical protein